MNTEATKYALSHGASAAMASQFQTYIDRSLILSQSWDDFCTERGYRPLTTNTYELGGYAA